MADLSNATWALIGAAFTSLINFLIQITFKYIEKKELEKKHKQDIKLSIFSALNFFDVKCQEFTINYIGMNDVLPFHTKKFPTFKLMSAKKLSEIKFYTKQYFPNHYKSFLNIEKNLFEIEEKIQVTLKEASHLDLNEYSEAIKLSEEVYQDFKEIIKNINELKEKI